MITTIYNEETISKEINTKWAGKTVHFAKETDSTNEWCKRMSKENAEHGTLAVAEFQSAGKGRLGRKWTAPEGSSVMMSILLKPEFEPQYASMLTLVMGLSVAQVSLQCIRFVFKETISAQYSHQIYQEIRYRTMSGMHKLCFVFEQIVNRLNDIPLSEHHLVIKGHKPVLHIRLNSMYQLNALVK